MDRGHLRAEDCVLLLLHLLGVGDLLLLRGADDALCFLFVADADRGDEGADTDSRRTQAVDLIDLQAGVDLVGTLEDLVHLIGGDGVHTAAEGVELDQLQVISCAHVGGRLVEPGVVHPLVQNAKGPLQGSELGDAVLGEDRDAIARDHLRDAVVDLRVDVVGAAGQDDALHVVILDVLENPLALGLDVLPAVCQFLPGGKGCL